MIVQAYRPWCGEATALTSARGALARYDGYVCLARGCVLFFICCK